MTATRIDGIKYNLEVLPEAELEGIRGHLLERHHQITADIEAIETELSMRWVRAEQALGHRILAGEIDCSAAYTEMGRFYE